MCMYPYNKRTLFFLILHHPSIYSHQKFQTEPNSEQTLTWLVLCSLKSTLHTWCEWFLSFISLTQSRANYNTIHNLGQIPWKILANYWTAWMTFDEKKLFNTCREHCDSIERLMQEEQINPMLDVQGTPRYSPPMPQWSVGSLLLTWPPVL